MAIRSDITADMVYFDDSTAERARKLIASIDMSGDHIHDVICMNDDILKESTDGEG